MHFVPKKPDFVNFLGRIWGHEIDIIALTDLDGHSNPNVIPFSNSTDFTMIVFNRCNTLFKKCGFPANVNDVSHLKLTLFNLQNPYFYFGVIVCDSPQEVLGILLPPFVFWG